MPLVSVIMPAYNRQALIGAAIDSILAQTLDDFEFVVVDDGSDDDTAEIVRSYADSRVRLAMLPSNCGVGIARAVGLAQARGEFVAVMDSDDLAHPCRLERQTAFMLDNPDVTIAGSAIVKDVMGQRIEQRHPAEDGLIKACLLSADGRAMINPTTMMRRSFLLQHNLNYRPLVTDEDHALWLDVMVAGGVFANLADPLLIYSRHPDNITAEHSSYAGTHQARKTPLRTRFLAEAFPQLPLGTCHAAARVMEQGGVLSVAEVVRGIDALERIQDCRLARFGISLEHVQAICRLHCEEALRVLAQAGIRF